MYIKFVSFSRGKKIRSSNNELDIFQIASNKKMEISAVLFFIGESPFRFFVTLICPLLLFVKKETNRSVVLFEQS